MKGKNYEKNIYKWKIKTISNLKKIQIWKLKNNKNIVVKKNMKIEKKNYHKKKLKIKVWQLKKLNE